MGGGQSDSPVIRGAAVEPYSGTVPAHDHPAAVMFDFVNPIGAGGRF
jgi:hypothetical protein